MSLPYRIGIAALFLFTAFMSGFFYGRKTGREAALISAVTAFQTREKIDYEIKSLDNIGLCIALGGLRDECAAFMRGVDEAAAGEQPGTDGR